MDLAYGKVPGFETYKVDRPITFGYDINERDFPITEQLYQAFRSYAVSRFKYTPAQVDKERKYVERALRSELVTAAYGTTTSFQVLGDLDNQRLKAIELLPQARQLALEGAKAKPNRETRSISNWRLS
jgi:hypothetical protein